MKRIWAIVLALAATARSQGIITRQSAVLFQNNGNWTAHAETPSSILFFDHVTLSEAKAICADNDETLLDAAHLSWFKLPLQYQAYLGRISDDADFWTAASTASGDETRPFICTNSAPLVDKVDTPFYLFPNANVTSNGTVYQGVRDHMAYRFLGIPFILQPVGDLRLTYPVQWYTNETDSVLNATTYGPTCPANGGYFDGNSYGLNPWGNSEACILMNIFTPFLPGTENPSPQTLKPVLFWLHGGGGTATDATYDGASLASRSDVVVVSVNWRGGNFGTLSFNDGYVDGNYGIADIVAGLQWVQDHIRAFGGNPHNVTVFGQSAGGESVVNMVRCPKAAGLFSGAIVQSGALGPAFTQAEVANVTVPAVADVCGDSIGAARLACLRSLSVDEFMNNISWSIGEAYANADSGAIIDGIWIANQSVAAARNGQLNRVNYMAGSMPEEGQSLLGTTISPNATDFNATLYSIVGNDIPAAWPPLVESSGLWNNGSNPINACKFPFYP
ncbi:alpha/beta-hydrolase [Aspergillus ellipticus CBS 707.79]|uniref:Carboxylic ester hydrolase n=1 Tax=Aspergillus ellipticus CBS 707.79 TaxID=1448320 RepID=A0A319DK14_9EURO|nr:alpha/beta-hydrolase [Aspergillus ellipticus CBS 707.79]